MRNGFFFEEEGQKCRRPKRAALIISLSLHALLIYALYHSKMTVNIFSSRSNVRNVLIVPSNKLLLPGPIEDYIRHTPSSDPMGFELKKSSPRPAAGRSTDEQAGEGRASDSVPDILSKSEAEGSSPSAQVLGRGLELQSRFQNSTDGKLSFNLSAVPDKIKDAPLGFEKKTAGGGFFQKYVQSGRYGSGTGTGADRAAGRGGSRARASFLSAGYDISPWARKALDLIQLNWMIPGVRDITGKSEVRISVVIEKNGLFSSFEILDKSNLELQNSAAVNSLLSSLPFPHLPDDFPAANLPALFVFIYDN